MSVRLINIYDGGGSVSLRNKALTYFLLLERPANASMRHNHLEPPTFAKHEAFIESRPYRAWYLIFEERFLPVGAVNLSKYGEIGISIFEWARRKGYARDAIRQIMALHPRGRYLAVISESNEPSQKLFTGLGFKRSHGNIYVLETADDQGAQGRPGDKQHVGAGG